MLGLLGERRELESALLGVGEQALGVGGAFGLELGGFLGLDAPGVGLFGGGGLSQGCVVRGGLVFVGGRGELGVLGGGALGLGAGSAAWRGLVEGLGGGLGLLAGGLLCREAQLEQRLGLGLEVGGAGDVLGGLGLGGGERGLGLLDEGRGASGGLFGLGAGAGVLLGELVGLAG